MDDQSERTAFCDFHFCQVRDFPHLLLIININIPCIVVQRLVLEHLQHISPLSLSKNTAFVFFVIQAFNLSLFI